MTRVLITGSSGFIAKHLIRTLAERGDQVVGWDCMWPSKFGLGLAYDPEYDLHRPSSDVMKRFSSAVSQVDQVYHLAGNADVGAYDTHPDLMAREWAMAAAVIGACADKKKPLVVASSAYARGNNTRYGRTKKGIENMAYLAQMSGYPLSTARIFNIFGPGQEKAVTYKSTVVLNLYRAFKKGEWSLKSPSALRDFIYIDDAIQGLLHTMLATVQGDSCQHDICSGELMTIQDVGHTMAALMGYTKVLNMPDPEAYEVPPYEFAGQPVIVPLVSLEEGLRRTIASLEETASV
ncbi:MAG: NAD(P)-dependent oxidoreductase [Pseudomonadota bacterium]|nr:NAD(P)-dependent oxidoreductase [Pseudomonadota bacterium]